MKISYNWLKDYIPENKAAARIIDNPEKIGEILTAVGLEVEAIHHYEQITNSLRGLLTGEVLTCQKHPDADKLKVTTVNVGKTETLQIVCGAPNVAEGQKVLVATIGSSLYPTHGEPITIKKAKIRGVASEGMLCAADEIGMGDDHEGIMVLPADTEPGQAAAEYFGLYKDEIFEIGLTPNRMDAMSHLGVAKDVCAYVSHHHNTDLKVAVPFINNFTSGNNKPVEIQLEDPRLCPRYAGVTIEGIRVAASPAWLQNRLRSIGLKPVNNLVDITNYILHETGQPLHAFDADKIKGNKVIVKQLADQTTFVTLDGIERKLDGGDIMICNGASEPMCIAGVFGGQQSGISDSTQNVFLESAVFDPGSIRRTMLRHGLRTEAAIRFEKGVNISLTVQVLKRAATLITEICGGTISTAVTDVYPNPEEPVQVTLSNHYLKKISGKNFHPDTVTKILKSLNFSIIREGIDEIQVAVPFSNPDITLPADIIEEIMRIDGLDNIEIPAAISMSPAIDTGLPLTGKKEKITAWLTGNGFYEIFTNSITNSDYFTDDVLQKSVKIINSLSEGLDVMRPSMLPSGLECISYNINRKNSDLLFFEFGKTYTMSDGGYSEKEELALYFTGNRNDANWNNSGKRSDIFFVKGVAQVLCKLVGLDQISFNSKQNDNLDETFTINSGAQQVVIAGKVKPNVLHKFSIKQPVYYLSFDWQFIGSLSQSMSLKYEPIARFPQVQRDLSMVVSKETKYDDVKNLVTSLQLKKLVRIHLFDVFESEKLGKDKKSFAISFTFSDKEKTLTDVETDAMMNKIITLIESQIQAEIRRNA